MLMMMNYPRLVRRSGGVRLTGSLATTATTTNRCLCIKHSRCFIHSTNPTCTFWRFSNLEAQFLCAASLELIVFFFSFLNVLKYLLPPVLVFPPVLLLLSLVLPQYVSLLPGACG